jgi:hypothetical protein
MRKRAEDDTFIAYVHGRIDKELETFAASLGVQASYLSERIAALLLSQGQRMESPLSSMRLEALSSRQSVESVEGTLHAHRASTRHSSKARAGSDKARKAKVKLETLSPIQKYWAKFTPLQRKRMMAKRHAKWSTEAKAAWKGKKKAA